jgi:hypothetical protein
LRTRAFSSQERREDQTLETLEVNRVTLYLQAQFGNVDGSSRQIRLPI